MKAEELSRAERGKKIQEKIENLRLLLSCWCPAGYDRTYVVFMQFGEYHGSDLPGGPSRYSNPYYDIPRELQTELIDKVACYYKAEISRLEKEFEVL